MAALDVKRVCQETKETSPNSVKKIILSQKNIKNVEDLSKFKCLEKIDLSKNEIEDASGLGGCTSISWLNVSNNLLTSLDFASKLKLLTVLNVGFNRIQDATPIGKLRSLKALILNNNELEELPNLEKLIHLNTLVVSHNCLRSVDISCCRSLIKLQASHNSIKRFPNIKANLELKNILLNDNKISKVAEDCLGENKKLELIDLGKNAIQKLKKISCLSYSQKIVNLNLRGNALCECEGYIEKVTTLFPRLQVLDSKPISKITSKSNPIKHSVDVTNGKRKADPDSEVNSPSADDIADETCKPKRKKLESNSTMPDCNKSSQKISSSKMDERMKLSSDDDLRIAKKSKKKNRTIESTDDGSVFFTFDRTPDETIVAMLNASSSSGKEIYGKKMKKVKEKKTKKQLSGEDAGSAEGELKESKLKKSKRKKESYSNDDDGSSSNKKKMKPKTKKSEEESRGEDLFSVGESELIGGNLDISGGQRTMNKKMKELAAAVKVSDVKKMKHKKTVSIGLDAFLAENTAAEEVARW